MLPSLWSFAWVIVGPAVLLALLFFNLTFIALGSSYIPSEELLDKEEENHEAGGG